MILPITGSSRPGDGSLKNFHLFKTKLVTQRTTTAINNDAAVTIFAAQIAFE